MHIALRFTAGITPAPGLKDVVRLSLFLTSSKVIAVFSISIYCLPEAVTQTCSLKQVFLEISQN